jgi:sugar lactone lactonase YvrE
MWPQPDEGLFNGFLYSVDASGHVDTLETEVGIPNALAFDPDRRRMYWADTFHATIWKWDYDVDSGCRSNKDVFFDYGDRAEARGLPDGGCVDVEGCYWSASVNGWALTRITPEGEIDRIVELPVAMPTMPAFGGADLSTIYVTSIDGGAADPQRSRGVAPGSLLAVDAGIRGRLDTPFAL